MIYDDEKKNNNNNGDNQNNSRYESQKLNWSNEKSNDVMIKENIQRGHLWNEGWD
jgi:hypothetical protein